MACTCAKMFRQCVIVPVTERLRDMRRGAAIAFAQARTAPSCPCRPARHVAPTLAATSACVWGRHGRVRVCVCVCAVPGMVLQGVVQE